MGGKNPAIVRPDADVERAAEGLVRGCFADAGQLRLSIERIYEPTVLTGVDGSMTLHGEETFGPVVSVYGYADDDGAVELANNTEYGVTDPTLLRSP